MMKLAHYSLLLSRFLSHISCGRTPCILCRLFPMSPYSPLLHAARHYVNACVLGCRCLGDRSPSFLFFGHWSDDLCPGIVLVPLIELSVVVCLASTRPIADGTLFLLVTDI